MQLKTLPFALLILALTGCSENPVTVDGSDENTEENTVDMTDVGPVTDCDENLSAFELLELWEMSNAKVYDGRHICFEGYVLSNETYGDLVQGSIAFKEFSDEDVEIPAVYCQFTGLNGETFLDYEIGDRIEIKGKLVCTDNENKHNFMFAKCSLPLRDKY